MGRARQATASLLLFVVTAPPAESTPLLACLGDLVDPTTLLPALLEGLSAASAAATEVAGEAAKGRAAGERGAGEERRPGDAGDELAEASRSCCAAMCGLLGANAFEVHCPTSQMIVA